MTWFRKSMLMVALAMLTLGVVEALADGQQIVEGAQQVAAGGARIASEFPDKPELMRRIGVWEALARKAETTHADAASMVKIYSNLGNLYEYAAIYPKAEEAMRREVSLLQAGPQDQLADALSHLATLHIVMGDPRAAEREQLAALRVREAAGDPQGIALTWNDLADFYIHQRQSKKALDYAQKAMDALGDNPKVDADGRIAVRQTLAYALCENHQSKRAVALMKEAVEMSKDTYGAESLQVGMAYFVLGDLSWKRGDMVNASEWMRRGTDRMKVDLGWGHTLYVNAMAEYARFLRERGQTEAATSAEREVRQAQSVVDARSLVGSANAFLSTGPK